MAFSGKSNHGQQVTFNDASMMKQLSKNNTLSLDSADDSKAVDVNETVILQIGERTFNTYKSTLCKSPYFKAMLSDKFGDKRSDGSYFIDRNGNHFAYLLDFLRCGYVAIPAEIAQIIQMEAQYFQISMDFSDVSRRFNFQPVFASESHNWIEVDKNGNKWTDGPKFYIMNILVNDQDLFKVRDVFKLDTKKCLKIQGITQNPLGYRGEHGASIKRFMKYIMLSDEYEYTSTQDVWRGNHLIRARIPKTFIIKAAKNSI